MVVMGHLYRYRRQDLGPRLVVVSAAIIGATALITGLQFVFPEVLSAFRRNPEALRAGEWWRIVTPLFVQPNGWLQCVFNGMFMLAFLPLAEKLYGNGLLALYFIPGVAVQAIMHAWNPEGGGSSSAIFGVMGGLLVYACRQRKELPPQYFPIAISGVCAAGVLSLAGDGHGPSLLIGSLVATMLHARPLSERRTATAARVRARGDSQS
jgi:membrane associated rhomboid family serine protease